MQIVGKLVWAGGGAKLRVAACARLAQVHGSPSTSR
jgi:hypothetical protein